MNDPANSLRVRIEADIADEARSVRMAQIFAQRAEGKRLALRSAPPAIIPMTGISGEVGELDPEGDGDDGFEYLHVGEADYKAVCANLTGSIIPESAFEKLRLRRALQNGASIEMARALESTGRFPDKPFFHGPDHPDAMTVIGLQSGAVLPIPALRRVNFFPAIAAANRGRMLRDVEHFIACHPGRSRMFTMTRGPRVAIHRVTLRQDFSNFNRRLSKLAARLRRELGVSMQWAGNELGSPEWVSGQMTVHLHAHILVTEPESMNPKKRAKIRRKIWALLTDKKTGEKTHWDDSGEIQNAREFVKYPVKDADLSTILREGGPGVLADLYEALRGMRFCRPMGQLRNIRAMRKADARRITAFSRFDGRQLEETGDWNAGKRPLASRNQKRIAYRARAQSLAARLACAEACRLVGTAAGDSGGLSAAQLSISPIESGRLEPDSDDDRPRRGDSDKKSPRVKNRVIARLAPAPYGGPICEPAVLVWGFDGDLRALLAQPRVVAIIRETAQAYNDAEEARALIRACAGACALAANQSSQRSANCPDALGELALLDAENRPPGYEDPAFSARN